MPRFFVDMPLQTGALLALPEEVARHIQVLRLQPGDALTLFNGQGGQYDARLAELGKRSATVELGAFVAVEAEPPYRITLAQGIAGGDKMDWLIEKAIELGASHIVPIGTARAVVRLAGERAARRQAHWQALIAAACEQCGRNRVPVVHPVEALPAWLARQARAGLVLSLRGNSARLAAVAALEDVTLLSGPEGGLAPAEEDAALARGWQPVHLGERVLRAETAPLAALAVLTLA